MYSFILCGELINNDTTRDEQLDFEYYELFMEMLDNIEFSDRTIDVELVKIVENFFVK